MKAKTAKIAQAIEKGLLQSILRGEHVQVYAALKAMRKSDLMTLLAAADDLHTLLIDTTENDDRQRQFGDMIFQNMEITPKGGNK